MREADRNPIALLEWQIRHLVADDGGVTDLVVEHVLLGGDLQRRVRMNRDRSEDAAIGRQDLLPVLHHDATRRFFPRDGLSIEIDSSFDCVRVFIVKMRLNLFQVAGGDLLLSELAAGRLVSTVIAVMYLSLP